MEIGDSCGIKILLPVLTPNAVGMGFGSDVSEEVSLILLAGG